MAFSTASEIELVRVRKYIKPVSYILISKDLIWDLVNEMSAFFPPDNNSPLISNIGIYFDLMNSNKTLYKNLPILVIDNCKNFIEAV